MMVSATAPETAMIAPTERSIPRVAITIVMPSATSISGALLRRMSMSGPYSWPSRTVMLMNDGRAIVLSTIRESSAAIGQNEPMLQASSSCARSPRLPGRCSR